MNKEIANNSKVHFFKNIEQWLSEQPNLLLENKPGSFKRAFSQTTHESIIAKPNKEWGNFSCLPNEIHVYIFQFLHNALKALLMLRATSSGLYTAVSDTCLALIKHHPLKNCKKFLGNLISKPILEKTDDTLYTLHYLVHFIPNNSEGVNSYHAQIAALWQWLNTHAPDRLTFFKNEFEISCQETPFKSPPIRRAIFLYLFDSLCTEPNNANHTIQLLETVTTSLKKTEFIIAKDLHDKDLGVFSRLLTHQNTDVTKNTLKTLTAFIQAKVIDQNCFKKDFIFKTIALLDHENIEIVQNALDTFSALIKAKVINKKHLKQNLINKIITFLRHENLIILSNSLRALAILAEEAILKKNHIDKKLIKQARLLLTNQKIEVIQKTILALTAFVRKKILTANCFDERIFELLKKLTQHENKHTAQMAELLATELALLRSSTDGT